MLILDGKSLSLLKKEILKEKVANLSQKPTLVVIQIGDNPISNAYINVKRKFGESIGVNVMIHKFTEDIETQAVLELINMCNEDNSVRGILVQLPLPPHIEKESVLNSILPDKDIDGLGIVNAGKLVKNDKTGKVPATPKGVLSLIKHYGINLEGKNILVLGRSNLVGLPLSILLQYENATVTIAHSKTKNLLLLTKNADILVSAIGKPHFIKKDHLKENVILIDIGNTKFKDHIVGDIDYEDVKDLVSAITPVPGGVGPMTVASLFENLLD